MFDFTLEFDGPVTTAWQARTPQGNLVGVTRDNLNGKFSYSFTSQAGYRLTGGHASTYYEAVRKGTALVDTYEV